MTCGEMAALSAKLRAPLTTLLSAGVKVSVTAQEAPGATGPQLWAAVIDGIEEVSVLKSSGALPQLVTFRVALVGVSAGARPKERFHVLGQKDGAGVAMLIFETKL